MEKDYNIENIDSLTACKNSYLELASTIQDWKHKTVTELGNYYLSVKDNDSYIASCYLAAIILKHWHLIKANYNSQKFKSATLDDCYNFVIDGIMSVLEKHVWTNPDSSLFGDSQAVEKAISITIYDNKLQFFRKVKRHKHQINYCKLSLTDLENDQGDDSWTMPYEDEKLSSLDCTIQLKIKELFENKDYFAAFLLDAIINGDVTCKKDDTDDFKCYNINKLRLKRHLKKLNDVDYYVFANNYSIDYDKVVNSAKYIKLMAEDNFDYKIDYKIKTVFKGLLRDEAFKDYLLGDNSGSI